MAKTKIVAPAPTAPDPLFDRVVSILEEARGRVVRAANSAMVTAYWSIGRAIVEELQGGDARAEYGARVIEDLAGRLNERYRRGFSRPNLWAFRQFYLAYSDRLASDDTSGQRRGRREELTSSALNEQTGEQILYTTGRESEPPILYTAGGELGLSVAGAHLAFEPSLSWSHYRVLMTVAKREVRDFYESEAALAGWTKVQLERQIATMYYERLLRSQDKQGMLIQSRKPDTVLRPIDVFKDPCILEFLDLPEVPKLHESDLEAAIINKLQSFLLEMGRGFAFVARQKRMRLEEESFYVDLVFYNYLLKCFVLIDLKVGKLTHQDIGQMDSYVRMFEAHAKPEGDNPTIGLILCSQKNAALAKYSVLNESKQIFAVKYLDYLPTEEELQIELMRERRLLEEVESNRPKPRGKR